MLEKVHIEGHIEIYDLELVTQTPVFIGSGDKYYKKEYAYKKPDKRNQKGKSTSTKLHIMDLEKLFDLLKKNRLFKQYEEFMEDPKETDLYKFFNEYGVSIKEIEDAASYSLEVPEEFKITDILEFIKDGSGNPYVPGSSIKGALRTVILLKLIEDGKIKSSYEEILQKLIENGKIKSQDKEKLLKLIEDESQDTENPSENDKKSENYKKAIKSVLSEIANYAEVECLNLLNVNDDKKNAINSVMRGISVSDSEIFNIKDLILEKKFDIPVDGNGKFNSINVIRESLKKDKKIKAKLCLDKSILKGTGIDIKFIRDAISHFGEYYEKYYLSKFKDAINNIKGLESYNETIKKLQGSIIIGGGSGFFAKNIIYEMLVEGEGLNLIKKYMESEFDNHKHNTGEIISPHCLKYAEYSQKAERYHFGICKVT